MQKKEQAIDYQYLRMDNQKEELGAKTRQNRQQFEEKQRRKTYIIRQAKKLKKISNYVRDLGVFKQMPLPIADLRAHNIPQQIILKLNEKDVIKSSQNRYQRMIKTGTIKKNWSSEDLSILVWLICKFCQTNDITIQQVQFHKQCWEMIEEFITGTTAEECLFKWMSFKKQSVTMYAWNKEEEDILRNLQKKYRVCENRWKVISKQLFKLNTDPDKIYRQPKQCREHFNSFLDPTIKKGIWTVQEDYMLICAYLKFDCQRRWCQISHCFKNRTENSLKNRFQLLYDRLKISKKVEKAVQMELIKKYIQQLREYITSCSYEDEIVAEADRWRKQAEEGNFIRSGTKRQAEMRGKLSQQQVNLKIEQNQSQNSYIIVRSANKEEKNLNSPLTQGAVQEQSEVKYKRQSSILSKSTQSSKSIVIPQFQYKQNIIQENVLLAPYFLKENGLGQIQNSNLQFPFIYERLFCEPCLLNKPSFQISNNVWKQSQ